MSPEDQHLATFRINTAEWNKFKALCKKETSNASAELLRFVRSCLKADAIPRPDNAPLPQENLENLIGSCLDGKLEPVTDEVAALRVQVEEITDRLGKCAA